MSGIEALALLGAISGILSITDVTVRVLTTLKDHGDSAKELPTALDDIHTTLPVVAETLKRLRDQVEQQLVDEGACKVLLPLCTSIENKCTQLKVTFDKVLINQDHSRPERLWRTVRSIGKEKEVEITAVALQRYATHLTHFQVTIAASTSQRGQEQTHLHAIAGDIERSLQSLRLHESAEGK